MASETTRAVSPAASSSSSASSNSSRTASPAEQEAQRGSKRRRVEFEQTSKEAAYTFEPPQGLRRALPDEALEQFDQETLRRKLASGCELWAIRLPEGLKLRHLGDVQLARPTPSSEKSQKLGTFKGKKTEYEVHALGTDAEDASSVGAGELNSLTALVADKTSRKYSKTSVPIHRRLVVRHAVSFPPPVDLAPEDVPQDEDAEQMQVTHQQPDGLNGFFAPAGFSTRAPKAPQKVEIAVDPDVPVPLQSGSESPRKHKSKKDKKRAEGEEAPDADESMADTTLVKKEKKEKKKKRKSEAV